MSATVLILRILHIGFGAFWIGVDIFVSFVLVRVLRKLGKDIERPAILAVLKAMPPLMMVSSVITAVTGVVLVGILRGWDVSTLLASGWGIAILIGFLGTLITLIVGFGLLPPVGIRIEKLVRALAGRAPSAGEAAQIDKLLAQADALSRVNAVLLIVVIISMAVARYV